ncbi:MAG: type II toxin-antitoxin system RelE/ParE family toxin [Ginsengibacter sp.]
MVKEVRWPLKVQQQLEKAYNYVLADSFQNAEKLKNDILFSTRKLSVNPERYPLDKYRTGNDGTFRAYELYHYRISYRILQNEIVIVRIRHTSMKPAKY